MSFRSVALGVGAGQKNLSDKRGRPICVVPKCAIGYRPRTHKKNKERVKKTAKIMLSQKVQTYSNLPYAGCIAVRAPS
jgi:hypothetical protein